MLECTVLPQALARTLYDVELPVETAGTLHHSTDPRTQLERMIQTRINSRLALAATAPRAYGQ